MVPTMAQLSGKVAAVTGGASGIGEATVRRFVKEGAKVAFADRDADRGKRVAAEIVASGGEVVFVEAHMEREAEAAGFIRQAAQRFGRLDILVNNAGTTQFIDHRNLDALTTEVWDRILGVNVKGTFYCCRAAARVMRDGGRIINIGSVAGVRGNGSSIAYAASKGAIHTMTLSLARALAPSITVNAIAPGLIETRWHGGHEAENTARAARFPAKRIGRPEDIAQMAVAFAAADNFLTGQVLVVDGGALL
jgi:3-oxoacyl-[acyl-carrier protein] reductase